MHPFGYARPITEATAFRLAAEPDVAFLAGGTLLVDLMRLGVMRPSALIDIRSLPYGRIEAIDGGGLRIGALALNADVARHPVVTSKYPALAQALEAGASPQVRNMATVGGNVMQRTRCPYFREPASSCNKREPGSGCSALEGYNRSHAILGGSDHCIATHPSDMCVALAALDAVVQVRGPAGERSIPFTDFHVTPGSRPDVETQLGPAEIIIAVDLPGTEFLAQSRYLKVRDRAAFAFALASAAVALELDGVITAARVAVGGVATKPWRSLAAETALVGKAPNEESFRAAAAALVAEAVPRTHNAFKVELVQRTVVRALESVGGIA